MANVFQSLGISEAELNEARELAAKNFTNDYDEQYKTYIAQVSTALLSSYPQAKTLSIDEIIDVICVVDVIGPDSHRIMKSLRGSCVGCGWCCSQTQQIVVDEEDTLRISRKLKQKRDDLFAFDGNNWVIKQSHPCGWWNPRTRRCQIYNDRPKTCRVWPLGLTEAGLPKIHAVAQCNFAVMAMVNKVIWTFRATGKLPKVE